MTSGPTAAISSGIHALFARVTIENSAFGTSSIRVPYYVYTSRAEKGRLSAVILRIYLAHYLPCSNTLRQFWCFSVASHDASRAFPVCTRTCQNDTL